jgi:hypothetical protein
VSKEAFICSVKDGSPVPADSGRWEKWMKGRDLILVTLEPNPRKHSTKQRAYYRGVVVPAVAEILESILKEPITSDDAHEWLKHRFIGPRKTRLGEIPPTTTVLTVEQFGEYLDKILEFFREHYDCHIPPADYTRQAA